MGSFATGSKKMLDVALLKSVLDLMLKARAPHSSRRRTRVRHIWQ